MCFKINEEIWEMIFVAPDDPILKISDNQFTLGVTVPIFKRIYIANDLYGDLLNRVIAHELTHAEFTSRGLYLPIYIEECLADITADNIVDVGVLLNNIQNNLYRYYSKF